MDETTNKRYRKHPIDLREDQQHNMIQREAEQRGKRVLLVLLIHVILQFRLNLGAADAQLLKNHSGQARLTFMRVALSHGISCPANTL